jgi:putative transposase
VQDVISQTAKSSGNVFADLGLPNPEEERGGAFNASNLSTLKYRPEFPDRLGSLQDARSLCQGFFTWYNTEHHHSGLGLLTPEVVHSQCGEQVRELRQQTLDAAYAAHAERFVHKPPQPPALPAEVWINAPPKSEPG